MKENAEGKEIESKEKGSTKHACFQGWKKCMTVRPLVGGIF